jgi:hypothetical protein
MNDALPPLDQVALTDEVLSKVTFDQLSGVLGGVPFVKIVVDRKLNNQVHFLNNRLYPLHAYYVCDHIFKENQDQFLKKIDSFNEETYGSPDRRFYFASLGRIKYEKRSVYVLETQEIDSMGKDLILDLFLSVKNKLEANFELFFKPANHVQEIALEKIASKEIPRILTSEIYANSSYISLNSGSAEGRVRYFATEAEFRAQHDSIEWFDIVVMNRIPDDVPRVSGMINTEFTTPLSHTNVLAAGWKIPNCIDRNIAKVIQEKQLDKKWIKFEVLNGTDQANITPIEQPTHLVKPNWFLQKVTLEKPDTEESKIRSLQDLRMTDRYKYGTKAANIGEMKHILKMGSNRILGFYHVKRPPRENLLPHIANFLKTSVDDSLLHEANQFLSNLLKVPKGIVLPFSLQKKFLESSPQIQQAVGKLKMALELDADEVDSLCVSLQKLILKTRMPDSMRDSIDQMIVQELSGVSTFVIRSSSNAEDLENFSAAGIYESINQVKSTDQIFAAVKTVWASLVSARSVRLRQQSGISLDDSYMGVIIQEEVESGMGGVMVTTHPMEKKDFRNVYINVSLKSVVSIVQGEELPMQYLYNTVEGGGYTLSLGSSKVELSDERLNQLQKMAFAGRLLQSHFSPDYTFSQPVDIEWIVNKDGMYFLQLRPYAK